VVIEDNKPDSTDDEAEAARGGVDPRRAERDANPCSVLPAQDTPLEISKPIGPSSREQWYDVEASCYEGLNPGLEPKEQQASAVSSPTTTTTTLPTAPLSHRTTRSASTIMVETPNAHQSSQRPNLPLSFYTRAVMDGVMTSPLNLRRK
jgi:hypothetical protein